MSTLGVIPNQQESRIGTVQWYALHTRSRHEKKVAEELQRKGVATFLPLISETRKWSDRRMQVDMPLFSCYVFVNVLFDIETRVAVLRTSGVLGFVGGNGLGLPIPSHEIEQIHTVLEQKIPIAAHCYLQVGQLVRIRGGALDGVQGILARFRGNNRLVLSVQTIQRSLSITVDGYDIEPVHRGKASFVI